MSRNDPPHKPVSGEKLCVTTQRVALLQTSEQVLTSLRMSVFPPIQRKKEAHDRELFVLFLCKSCIDEHHQFKALSLTPKFQERLNDEMKMGLWNNSWVKNVSEYLFVPRRKTPGQLYSISRLEE